MATHRPCANGAVAAALRAIAASQRGLRRSGQALRQRRQAQVLPWESRDFMGNMD